MEPDSPTFATDDLLAQATWVRALALRLIQDPTRADDLAQDTLVAALEHRPATDRALRPWLAAVLRSRAAWLVRGDRGREARESEVARGEALPSSSELAARAEAQQRLVAEVLALDDPYRSLVLLRFYEGLTPAEIARRRGQPVGTVRGQLSRAIAKLRERLDARDRPGQLDWRSAFLPLTREPAVGAGSMTAPVTVVGMHVMIKVSIGAALAACAWLFLLGGERESSDESTATLDPSSPAELTGESVARAAPAVELETAPTPATQRVGSAQVPSVTETGDIEGVVTIREPSGGARPARDFLLTLVRAGDEREAIRTDSSGRFRSREAYASGPVRFDTPDHEDLDPSMFVGAEALPTGQPETLSVDFECGEPLALSLKPRREFELQIVGPLSAVTGIRTVELRSDMASLHAPLRRTDTNAGAGWVRFAPIDLPTVGWTLHVESADGLWTASSPTPPTEDFDPAEIRLDLQPAASLEVSVPWVSSTEPDGISVTLRSASLPLVDRGLQRVAGANGRTDYARGGLAAGPYVLAAFAEGTPVKEREVELRAGEVTRVAFDLEYAPALFPLELRLSSETGAYHGMVTFMARGADRSYVKSAATWEQDADGEWAGSQDLGQVPPGEYTIELMMCRPMRAWDQTQRTVTVPGPPLHIVCLDGGETVTLGLRVVDASTGGPIDGARCELLLAGEGGMSFARHVDGVTRWPDIPLDVEPTWRVRADGYEPAEGDWSEFAWEDGERRATAALKTE